MFTAFMVGRNSAPPKVEIQKVEVIKIVEVKVEEKEIDKTKSTTIVVRPDGTKITRTKTNTKKSVLTQSSIENDSKMREQTIIENTRGITVSVLVGASLTNMLLGPVYGASISKPFIGPIELGLFAFTDLRVGVSIGMEL